MQLASLTTLLALIAGITASNWTELTRITPPMCPLDGLQPTTEPIDVQSLPSTLFNDDATSTTLVLYGPPRSHFLNVFAVRLLFISAVFFVAAILTEDDQQPMEIDFYRHTAFTPKVSRPAKVSMPNTQITLSVKPLKIDELDEELTIPEKERIQDVHLITANFSGPKKMAHPDRSFIYVHYRPIGTPKMPHVLFYNTDRNGRRVEAYDEQEDDGCQWEFKTEAFDENAFSEEQRAEGFYAMHKVSVQLDSSIAKNFINTQKAVFKVQRSATLPATPAASPPSTPIKGSFKPVSKKSSLSKMVLLKSLRNSLKTNLRDVASAFRKTPSKTSINEENFDGKMASLPSLNIGSSATSEC